MDNNEHGTNLAEVGTDCISRQVAIDRIIGTGYADQIKENVIMILMGLPSAQPKRGKWIEYEQEFMLEEPLKTVQKTVRECFYLHSKNSRNDWNYELLPELWRRYEM